MDFLYFILWLIVALSASFALIWLGLLFASAKRALDSFQKEIIPLLKEIQEAVSNINSEIERIEGVFTTIDNLSSRLKSGVKQVEEVLTPGLGRVAMLLAGLKRATGILLKGK